MKRLSIFLIVCVFHACQENTIYDKQTYSKFPTVENLRGKDIILHDSIFFTLPQILIEDSLCCIYDMAAKEEHYCHIFKFPEFEYKYSMVKVGRGENEIINPAPCAKLYRNNLYIADCMHQRLLRYDLTDTSSAPTVFAVLKDYIFDFTILNDTNVAAVSLGKNDTHRIKIYNSAGDVIDSLFPLPKFKKTRPGEIGVSEIWASYLAYDAPDNTLVMATQHGEVLESFNLMTKEHRLAVGPGEKPQLGHKGKAITFSGKIVGFSHTSVHEGYMYTLFSGINNIDFIWNNAEENYKMQVYDQTGQPIKQYTFDRPITSFYIDWEHNRIYTTDKTSEWMLSVFEL